MWQVKCDSVYIMVTISVAFKRLIDSLRCIYGEVAIILYRFASTIAVSIQLDLWQQLKLIGNCVRIDAHLRARQLQRRLAITVTADHRLTSCPITTKFQAGDCGRLVCTCSPRTPASSPSCACDSVACVSPCGL